MAYRVIHYINQFFGGIGGEEKADIPPEVREGFAGPGMALAKGLDGKAEIVATIICGDNYCVGNQDEVGAVIADAIRKYNADAFIAGPAFNAGRYGMACGTACAAAAQVGVATMTAMFPENPGVELFKSATYILPTADSAKGMGQAIAAMTAFLPRLLNGDGLKSAAEEGYIERGVRINKFYDEVGAERAVAMLLNKVKGEDFETEYKMPVFDRVTPRPGVKDMEHTTVALVTSGGIVPRGNPDHIAASSARNYGEYDLEGVTDLTAAAYQTAHGGYDQTYANQDPDRVLPVDVLRDMEKEGAIGKLHRYFYSTVGNGTAVGNAKKWGGEIGQKLRDANVQAVILTSTWGTCTRCGATLAKAIEDAGDMPVVHMASIVPISQSVGANRIIPTVAIPYPLGDPALPPAEEKALRRALVEKALTALKTDVSGQTVFK